MSEIKGTKTEYRQLASPNVFNEAIDKAGVLSNRDELAEQSDYDWHARECQATIRNGHRRQLEMPMPKLTLACPEQYQVCLW